MDKKKPGRKAVATSVDVAPILTGSKQLDPKPMDSVELAGLKRSSYTSLLDRRLLAHIDWLTLENERLRND